MKPWPAWARSFSQGGLKLRLWVLALLPLAVFPVLATIIIVVGNHYAERLLQHKVTSDLAVTHNHLLHVQNEALASVSSLANSPRIRSLADGEASGVSLTEVLASRKENVGFDFLAVLDASGKVVGASEGFRPGDSYVDVPVLRDALASRGGRVGLEVVSAETLGRLSPTLPARAQLELLETPMAAESASTREDRGLLVIGAATMPNLNAKEAYTVVGGFLLNRQEEFVDYLSRIGSTGGLNDLGVEETVTLFLSDVRIATTVRRNDGQRALGTRVSQAVKEHVLDRGEAWVRRAFVVNHWAYTAYDPIVDYSGNRIGMLFVGIPEEPFDELRWRAFGLVILLLAALSLFATLISWRLVHGIMQPLGRLETAMLAVKDGEMQARVGNMPGNNELVRLGVLFDQLLDTIGKQTSALRQWGQELDDKVAQRTSDLAVANEALISARDAAEKANRTKSNFLANMSHEIRTPLNGILGMVHLLRREDMTDRQAEKLTKIDVSAEHLLNIINDILDLSKIEAGKLELEETAVSVERVIGNVAFILHDRALAKHLSLLIDVPPVGFNLLGDPTRLQQAMLNYATNAVKFTEQGNITLRAKLAEETTDAVVLRFEVEDTGIGIDAATLDRLFASFEQADNSTTRKYGGTGLGLAITKNLARLMGGDAGADSLPGAGSTFWFTARLKKGDAAGAAEADSYSDDAEAALLRNHAGCRILLAEDEPINCEISLMMLDDVGLVVDVAEDGIEAVELASRNSYDLILMDMQMPRMDGLDATRKIRNLPNGERIPILAMTANAFAEDKARCLEAGMNDFIGKPVKADRLFKTLLKWLSKPRS